MDTQIRNEKIDRLEALNETVLAAHRDLTDAEYEFWQSTRKEIMDAAVTKQPDPSTLRPADAPAIITKQRSYSVLRAIGMSLSDPNVGDIGLEREMHQT